MLTGVLNKTMIDLKGFTIRVVYRDAKSEYLIVNMLYFIAVRTLEH